VERPLLTRKEERIYKPEFVDDTMTNYTLDTVSIKKGLNRFSKL
jgi:hypothetical protein